MKKVKVIVHAAGGAGINMVYSNKGSLSELDSNFADFDINAIDTSFNNINAYQKDTVGFHKIANQSYSNVEINGSGGSRFLNAESIVPSVQDYLDQLNIKEKVSGEINVVVASASGGSGGVISSVIVDNLIKRGVPVIPILISDSSDMVMTDNTIKTLKTFSNIAMRHKVALPVSIFSNDIKVKHDTYDKTNINTTYANRKSLVDSQVVSLLTSISLLFSGKNHEIDFEDMCALVDTSKLKVLDIAAGLYTLEDSLGFDKLNKHADSVIGCRTVYTVEDKLEDPVGKFLSYKVGFASTKVKEVIGENTVSLFTRHNFIETHMQFLVTSAQSHEQKSKTIKAAVLSEDKNEDDDYMVF